MPLAPQNSRATRSRIRVVVAGAIVLVAGLLSTRVLGDTVGDVTGGALYALLVYLVFAFVLPHVGRVRISIAAFVVCTVIEFWQLTGQPARLAEVFPPAALLFGTTFTVTDLPPYAVGAIVGLLLDPLLRPRKA